MFDIPPLFKAIHEESGTSWQEMYKVFNMGHRLELYVDESIAADVIDISNTFGIGAQIVGRVEKAGQAKVTVQSEYGTFEYTN
jgi:phosphoribosylformylglycinamidine cyclo-ligase